MTKTQEEIEAALAELHQTVCNKDVSDVLSSEEKLADLTDQEMKNVCDQVVGASSAVVLLALDKIIGLENVQDEYLKKVSERYLLLKQLSAFEDEEE